MTLTDFSDLVARARPSVVHIGPPHGVGRNGELQGGTGFAIADDLIITSHHVLRTVGSAPAVTTVFDRAYPVTVVRDEPGIDLALLTVADAPPLAPLALRTSGLRVGEVVVAMGSAFGIEAAATAGILSGVDLTHQFRHGAAPSTTLHNLLVTDALIGRGNSGGPLLDVHAQALGVATGVKEDGAADPSGLGFVVPARTVAMFHADVLRFGRFRRGTLKLRTEMRPLTPEEQRLAGGQDHALTVLDVVDRRPTRNGVEAGDVLLRFGDVRLDEPGTLTEALHADTIGHDGSLEMLRGTQLIKLVVCPAQT